MPAITVSAVDTVNDKLTGVAHGLTTGDRLRVRNVGGALPTGLAGVTDYFAIRVDVDNIKVATSSANALAGTPVVDLTGAGSGTTTIEYGLPYCIPTAAAAVGTQIKSANDNGTWAALVALYDLLTGQAQSIFTAVLIAVDLTLSANKHVTVSGTGLFKHGTKVLSVPAQNGAQNGNAVADGTVTSSATAFYTVIPLPVGVHISSVDTTYNRSSGTLTVVHQKIDSAGSVTTTALFTDAVNTGWRTNTTALSVTVGAGEKHYIKISGATSLVSGVAISYDQP